MKRAWPFLLALFGGCAAMRSLFSEPYPYHVTPGAVKIDGPASRASGVAFGDYLDRIAAGNADLMAWDPDAGGFTPEEIEQHKPLWDCVEDPRGYDVWYHTDDGGTRYIIEIYIKPEVCLGATGGILFGDVVRYEIDAKSFTIINRDVEE